MSRHPPLRRLGFAVQTGVAAILAVLTRPVPTRRLIPLGGALGRAAVRLPFLSRRIRRNLDLIWPDLPDARRRSIHSAVGDNFGRLIVEYLRLPELASDPDLIEIDGAAHLAAAKGRGVVLVTAHFGNWEAIRLATRSLGVETAIIYRAFNNPSFDRHAQRVIAAAGEPVFHKGRAGARGLLRHVAEGGAVLILIDQRQTGAPLLPFLGRDAETATAAADLGHRFDAAVIPVSARRDDDGRRFRVTFEPEVRANTSDATTASLNASISRWIEADPGQWFWLHNRWTLRPRGDRIRAAKAAP